MAAAEDLIMCCRSSTASVPLPPKSEVSGHLRDTPEQQPYDLPPRRAQPNHCSHEGWGEAVVNGLPCFAELAFTKPLDHEAVDGPSMGHRVREELRQFQHRGLRGATRLFCFSSFYYASRLSEVVPSEGGRLFWRPLV